ncbi:uncharacterized protein LOC130712182 [Lotus japonicus]|uniref:uncharacterized protein LOC130712182 n=1 Tax=Lotus japonicus TaxID=34305 RepID=UPI00258B5782|nr:uncharacterized protein LOC130712182 [Lotus japonicus]
METSSIKMLRIQALSTLHMSRSFFQPNNFSLATAKLDLDFNVQIDNDNEEIFDKQQGFSFGSTEPKETLIFADDIFDNGQIKPIFPVSNNSLLIDSTFDVATSPLQSLLKKPFVEKSNIVFSKQNDVLNESQSEPSLTAAMVKVDASNVYVKKRHSTRFSKMWRFLWHINQWKNNTTNGTFDFLNPSMSGRSNKGKVENVMVRKGKSEKRKMRLSAHEKLYVMNRMRKEKNKHRSFLPYRPELVGIFANVNGFSRSLHPTPN